MPCPVLQELGPKNYSTLKLYLKIFSKSNSNSSSFIAKITQHSHSVYIYLSLEYHPNQNKKQSVDFLVFLLPIFMGFFGIFLLVIVFFGFAKKTDSHGNSSQESDRTACRGQRQRPASHAIFCLHGESFRKPCLLFDE